MTDSDHALEPLLQRTDDTPAGRLERIGYMQAIVRLAKAEETWLRERLEEDADRIEAATGGTFKVQVDGLGYVQRTAPKPKPVVDDPDALGEWLAENFPDLTGERDELAVTDTAEALDAILELSLALSIDEPYAVVKAAAQRLLAVLEHTVTTLLPEDPVKALKSAGCMVSDTGVVVTTEGEVVPGFDVKHGARTLRAVVAPAAKASMDALLSSRLELDHTTPTEGSDDA